MSFSFGEGNVEFASPVGRISSLLGLGNHFRTKLVRLLGIGYALRVKLPLFIFTGFAASYLLINYIPTVILEFEVEEEEVEEEDSQDEEEDEEEENIAGSGAQTNEASSQT